jgi:hypothetical protein
MMTTLVLLEDIDEMNPMTPRKIMNSDRSGPHEPSKCVGAYFSLDYSCGTIQSLWVTFLDVVVFVLSRSFQ